MPPIETVNTSSCRQGLPTQRRSRFTFRLRHRVATRSCHSEEVTSVSSTQASSCDLLITGGRILDLVAESGVVDDAVIVVRDVVIVGVGPSAQVESLWRAMRVIDATGQAISAGFIDAHVHLAAFLESARPDQPSIGPRRLVET